MPIPPGSKGPRGKGWQLRENAIFGTESVAKFDGHNAGLLHEWSHTVAIDIDDFNAADAWLTAREVSIERLFMADDAVSVSSGTPNRGKLLYRLPEGVEPLRTIKLDGVQLEFRCIGAQDVIAGKHPGGGTYTVMGDPATMPVLPGKLLALWQKLLANGAAEPRHNGDDDVSAKFSTGGRNDALFRLGRKLHNIAKLSESGILAALQAENAARCDPPLPDSELATIAHSAATLPEREAAAKYVHTESGGDAVRSITIAAARLPADWVEVEQQPPPFVVERILPEGEAGSCVSPGGGNKSTLKLFESVHIILGRDLYGRRVLKSGVVLCVSKEDRAELIDYRLKKICRGLRLSEAELRAVHKNFLRLDLRGDAFMLQRFGADRIPFRSGDVSELLTAFEGEGIASAWFDTASRFGTGEGNQEAAVSIDACTVLADGWRCTVELLHHVSQGIARTGTVDMHAGRGGTAFVDNGRFARQLVRHADDAAPGAIAYRSPAGIDPKAETLIRMHLVKLTGAKYDMHAPIWIERRDDWEFICAEGDTGARASSEDRKATARTEQAATDDRAVLAFVTEQLGRTTPQRMSQNDLIETRQRIARGLSAHRVREAVGRLRLDGKLIEVELLGKARGARTFLAPNGWQEGLT